MIKIEKISNGYLLIFKNTDNKLIRYFMPSLNDVTTFLKQQFEPEVKEIQ
jgi:hypothetical protein